MKRVKIGKGFAVFLSALLITAMVPAILLVTSSAVSAQVTWWNDAWPYRRKITISGSHPENFQIKIVIPSDIPKSMYPSIRFIEDETGDPLPYWIERNESGYLNVAWVRRLQNTDDSIYMYYGNPYATSAENGDDVFLFFDDFLYTSLDQLSPKWGRSSTGVDVFGYVLRLEDYNDQEAFIEHGPGQGIGYLNTRRIIEFRIKNASTWRGGVCLEGPGWGIKEMAGIFKADGDFKFFVDGTWGQKLVEGNKWYIGQIILHGPDGQKEWINVNFYFGEDNANYRELLENVRDWQFGDWAPEEGGWYIDKYKLRVWNGGGTSSYYYDWFFVRRYNDLGPDPVTTVGSEETNPTVGYLSGSASISEYPWTPDVQSVVPADTAWTPYVWTTVTVTVWDGNMNLSSITLMAYESSLGSGDPDSTRNHYTWQATKSEGTWSFSCPLGSAYIDTTGCSVSEDANTKTYTATFKVRVAKTAAPGTWDLYASATDDTNLYDYLENANAVTVQVYLEMALSTNTLTFLGMQGQSVYASQSPMTVTVTSNQNFDIKVKAAGDWVKGADTMPASATKAIGETTVSLSTAYQNVWSNVQYGEDVAKQIQWRLDIPADAVPGDYTNTFYVRVE
ncbi:MAG: DUF2341 domain-containing protein [Candidatus Hadarchaeales archaeon]